MEGFVIGLGIVAGFVFGYIFHKLNIHREEIEDLKNKQTNDWYDLTMRNTQNSNHIEQIENYLKIKFPEMDKEYFEQYYENNK